MTRIVCLHGFLGRPSDWMPIQRAFSDLIPGVQCEAVDIFSSLRTFKSKSMVDWAKSFNREQKSKHVERNLLIGYSMGGRLALQAAMDKPGLWDEVILVSSHPGLTSEDDKSKRLVSDLEWAEKFSNMPWNEV